MNKADRSEEHNSFRYDAAKEIVKLHAIDSIVCSRLNQNIKYNHYEIPQEVKKQVEELKNKQALLLPLVNKRKGCELSYRIINNQETIRLIKSWTFENAENKKMVDEIIDGCTEEKINSTRYGISTKLYGILEKKIEELLYRATEVSKSKNIHYTQSFSEKYLQTVKDVDSYIEGLKKVSDSIDDKTGKEQKIEDIQNTNSESEKIVIQYKKERVSGKSCKQIWDETREEYKKYRNYPSNMQNFTYTISELNLLNNGQSIVEYYTPNQKYTLTADIDNNGAPRLSFVSKYQSSIGTHAMINEDALNDGQLNDPYQVIGGGRIYIDEFSKIIYLHDVSSAFGIIKDEKINAVKFLLLKSFPGFSIEFTNKSKQDIESNFGDRKKIINNNMGKL